MQTVKSQGPQFRMKCRSSLSKGLHDYFIIIIHFLIVNVNYIEQCGCQRIGFCQNDTIITSDDCERIQGIPIAPEKLDSETFDNALCFCDSACFEYRDCCPDMINLEEMIRQPDSDHYNKWICQKEPFMKSSSNLPAAYMVASCPPNYGAESIVKRCRKQVQEQDYDYSLDYPVVSMDTNITYVNVYCAECHNENITNLFNWQVEFRCTRFEDDKVANCNFSGNFHLWKYVPGERRWIFDGNQISYDIWNFEDYVHSKYVVRKCNPHIIGHCPDHLKGTELQLLCATHSLHVMSLEDNLIYKNKYCAACHNQTTNLTCSYLYISGFVSFDYSPFFDHKKISFSRLLSFRKNDNNQLCDSLQNQCVDYQCGINYYRDESGQCVLKSDANQTGGLYDNCPKVSISEDNIIWLNNGSIFINVTNQIYTPNEYENKSNSEVLICVDKSWMLWKYSRAQAILSTVCVTLSLISLSVHIAVHIIISELRNLPGKILLCLSVSMFVGQLCFELQGFFTKSIPLCLTAAVIMHYSFLSTFFWMNVMAIDCCYTFARRKSCVKNTTSKKLFRRYSVYAWSIPAIIVILSVFNELFEYLPEIKPNYYNPLGACWINNRWALLVFFVIPLTIIILENIILFTATVVGICRATKIAKMAHTTSVKGDINTKLVLIYTKLAIIVGLTWVFGFMAMLLETDFLWYLYIAFNASQGIFIFLAFTCKRKVYGQLKTLVFKKKAKFTGSKIIESSSSSKTMSTSVKLSSSSQVSMT